MCLTIEVVAVTKIASISPNKSPKPTKTIQQKSPKNYEKTTKKLLADI